MSLDSAKENADVRFFGAHDRAWVPVSHCLIFSDKDPNSGKTSTPTNNKSKNQKGIADALKEKDEYIKNMKERFGFRYTHIRETLDPLNLQIQLENQLPGIKKSSTNGDDKNQKEKLTLKIVKASDGTQTIEKTPKINENDRHPLYMVLSRNEDISENNSEKQSRVKAIILKRNTDGDKEKEKEKGRSRNTSLSETSESNFSSVSTASLRRKSAREPARRRKSLRKDAQSITPEPEKKKQKKDQDESANNVLAAVALQPKPRGRPRTRDLPAVVAAKKQAVPPGTSEIYQLNEKPSTQRVIKRSQSFSRSQEKDKKEKNRRLSTHSTPSTINHEKVPQTTAKSATKSRASTPFSASSSRANSKRASTNEEVVKEIVIKDEPLSDNEEIVIRNQVTMTDLAGLVNDNNNPAKRKTILISTSDNSNDSFQYQGSRARKSFPKPLNQPADNLLRRRLSPMKDSAMVCIPQVFSTPPSDMATPNSISSNSPSSYVQSQVTNGSDINQPEVTLTQQTPTTPQLDENSSLPRLVPKPAGVFTSEGNTFQRESGDVAALFSQNAHRMTDYFKSLLVDTISAISNGVSDAQNVILKLENEKLKQQISTLKTENQQKMEKLRKEHAIEINTLKNTYEGKIKAIHDAHSDDKVRLIKEIRQQCEHEKQRAIEATRRETKKMTWCSNCTKEARFYCCWNTSYCGPACQKSHWSQHQKCCTNVRL